MTDLKIANSAELTRKIGARAAREPRLKMRPAKSVIRHRRLGVSTPRGPENSPVLSLGTEIGVGITPRAEMAHPGETTRLAAKATETITADRIHAAITPVRDIAATAREMRTEL